MSARQRPSEPSDRGSTPRLRPRDAATLILVERTGPAPRVLMGRRRPDQVFLPGTFVFPGGRVEAADRALARHLRLPPSESACLVREMRRNASPRRASALALAALRETFEETGILVGTPEPSQLDAGTGETWSAFIASGFRPGLDSLTYFARAITPPANPRRYDTRFFIVEATEIAHRAAQADGELLDIGWVTIEAARRLELPSITRHIVEDIAAYLDAPATPRRLDSVPFYAHRRGIFERKLVPRAGVP